MATVEAIPKHSYLSRSAARRDRRWAKKQARRMRRRLERLDPEHVPPRVTRGWAD